jgi:metal-sulfur cluster biosynthetic enzyme
MSDSNDQQKILAALEQVEHPAIATTLLDLGILRDPQVSAAGEVSLTLVLPFPNIPEAIRNYMVGSLAAAAQSAGGELAEVRLAVMNQEELQAFLAKEQQHWRG